MSKGGGGGRMEGRGIEESGEKEGGGGVKRAEGEVEEGGGD